MKTTHLCALRTLFFVGFLCSAFLLVAQAAENKILAGLVLDQPVGLPTELESSFVFEVAERLEKRSDSLDLEILYFNPDGEIVHKDGTLADLSRFEALWIHQGDKISDATPLFGARSLEKIRHFAQNQAPRRILLTGGAPLLLQKLEWATVSSSPMTFGDDRIQAGLAPADPQAFMWRGLCEDRGVFWMSNAVFPAFSKCQIASPSTVPLAKTPGGPFYALTLSRVGECDVFALPWRFSLLYDNADEFFRKNAEMLILNILEHKIDTAQRLALENPPKLEPQLPTAPLRRAVEFLVAKHGTNYPRGAEFLERLSHFESGEKKDEAEFALLRREALLANPDVDFRQILFIKRKDSQLGLPHNYNSNSVLPKSGYENTIQMIDIHSSEESTIFMPPNDFFVGDLELHFDADRLLFSMPSPNLPGNAWRLWELRLAEGAKTPAEATLFPTIEDPDVDNYDACYLPDDGVIFCSTACFTGVPCIDGSGHVCNLYRKYASDGKIRQLTLEQDHDWCPTLLPNGRVLYLRWEYSDLPHGFSRILFHANPDGTNQSEYYGSGSYYPAAMFYARPLPGSGSRFAAIVTGHHEQNRVGDLVLFDPSKGRKENEGAIQRIPGWGKPVQRVILDLPIAQNWPKFTHPFPISEEFFLVSCKRNAQSPWEICLVDIFDNILPLKSAPGYALFEPTPLRKTTRPPALLERRDDERKDADVFIADVYFGGGLKGVPPGPNKPLRLVTYEFSYQGMGAEPHSVGLDGPWDPKRILGTVPVYPDGSASFRIPAYTPVAFQPLDEEGRAVQYMRSWTTAMPGESVSCSGCHENQNSVPPPMRTPTAAKMPPVELTPFYGAARGFSFEREIQPILDAKCVACHEERGAVSFRAGHPVPAFENAGWYNQKSRFSPSYYQLRRFVRTQTKESQMGVHQPYEFHADATHLVQLLKKGHYETTLSREEWDKLYAWIDLNAPYYGSWGESRNYEIAPRVKHQFERRLALRKLYALQETAVGEDPSEFVPPPAAEENAYPHRDGLTPRSAPKEPTPKSPPKTERFDLGNGVSLEVAHVPDADFAVGRFEITNEQYRCFDPSHDSGWEYSDFIQFSPGEAGWLLSRARQPVVRISYAQASAFCEWLSEKTGRHFAIPTEEQWKIAAAGGTSSPFWFGEADVDYGRYENLSDISNQRINTFSWLGRKDALPPWRIADTNVDDRVRVSAFVGSYRPNPYGLYDVHGNVSEWTSTLRDGKHVVRGGSWYTPARWSTLESFRLFEPHQGVFDVGFRVILLK
ncbi:MAG: SUMF1/EgtB/PvdO family nonheme iron enzyme [Planctomycetia bacterium]|nr:SUMF1/EgtB/PvdO family nonheme iron enzyme [Planctomycetia bacterium]